MRAGIRMKEKKPQICCLKKDFKLPEPNNYRLSIFPISNILLVRKMLLYTEKNVRINGGKALE